MVEFEEDLVNDQLWEGERDGGAGVDSEPEVCVEMQAATQVVIGCPVWGGRVKELVGAQHAGEKRQQPWPTPFVSGSGEHCGLRTGRWAGQEACYLLCFIRSEAACLSGHISGFQSHFHC